MDCSQPGSSVHGIFQARILEWVAISYSDIRHKILEKIKFFEKFTEVIFCVCVCVCLRTSLVAQTVKRLSTKRETRVRSLGREDHWRRKWQSTPVLLPGKSQGQRSLVGYSPWGCKESDTCLILIISISRSETFHKERRYFPLILLSSSCRSLYFFPMLSSSRPGTLYSQNLFQVKGIFNSILSQLNSDICLLVPFTLDFELCKINIWLTHNLGWVLN